jgi:HEAT repeat protein
MHRSKEQAITAQEIEKLINALRNENWDSHILILDELIKIGEPAVFQLIEVLKDSSQVVRQYAIFALGEIKDRRAVEPLIEMLLNEGDYTAAIALEKIGDERAIKPFIEAIELYRGCGIEVYILFLLKEFNEAVKEATLKIIAEYGYLTEAAFDALSWLITFTDGEPDLRLLLVALQAPQERIRFEAVSKLSDAGDATALLDLVKIAENDPSPKVKSTAKQAIENIKRRTKLEQND